MVRVAVEPGDFDRAALPVDSGSRGSRASDALRLAVVLRLGFDLATFDRDLAHHDQPGIVEAAPIGIVGTYQSSKHTREGD